MSTEQKKIPPDRKFLVFFLCIAALTLLVYGPSLHHMPRSDQLIYLANTADQTDWVSLAIKDYSLTRQETAYAMPNDLNLRPILYFISGTEKWLFGYQFIYWQLFGILLHLLVIWFLLKLLWQRNASIFAALLTLFFSVLFANIEMVIWHTIHSYLLFVVLILIVLIDIQAIVQSSHLGQKKILKVLSLLTIATLIFEFGAILSILIAAYMYVCLKDSTTNTPTHRLAFLFIIPGVIYFLLNFIDMLWHGQALSMDSQSIFTWTTILQSIVIIPKVLFWWVFSGLFPTLLDVLALQRTFICPQYVLRFSEMIQPISLLTIPAVTGILTVLLFLFIIKKTCPRPIQKNQMHFLCFLLVTLAALAFIIAIGRISTKGFISIMGTNSYYNYFFWIFGIIFIYHAAAYSKEKSFAMARLTRTLAILCLSILILVNISLSYRLNVMLAQRDRSFRLLNHQILALLDRSTGDTPPSFNLSSAHTKEFTVDWINSAHHAQKKGINIIKILYPHYYTDNNPSFSFSRENSGNWIRTKNN